MGKRKFDKVLKSKQTEDYAENSSNYKSISMTEREINFINEAEAEREPATIADNHISVASHQNDEASFLQLCQERKISELLKRNLTNNQKETLFKYDSIVEIFYVSYAHNEIKIEKINIELMTETFKLDHFVEQNIKKLEEIMKKEKKSL